MDKTVAVHIEDKTIKIKHGEIGKYFYSTVAHQRSFKVFYNGCSYKYVMPSSIEKYSRLNEFHGEVLVQLEQDRRIHLVPPDSVGAVAFPNLASMQMDGFPISPIEKQCD